MVRRPRRFGILVLTATVLALAGCSGIEVSTPPDRAPGPIVQQPQQPQPAGNVPGWYGDSFDASGCPIPRAGASIALASDSTLLRGAASDRGWCVYASPSPAAYFIIPPTAESSFASEIRAALQPLGWQFEGRDEQTPQWTWLTEAPDAASAAGLDPGSVQGALFAEERLTADDVATYRVWFVALFDAFQDWQPGDPGYIFAVWS